MAKMKFEQFSGWITAEFGDYYRQNRHRNKKTKLMVEVTIGDKKLNWEVLCRLERNNEVLWEFPEDCLEIFQKKVRGLISDEEVREAFQKMERKKTL